MVKTFYFDMWKNTVISLVYVCMYFMYVYVTRPGHTKNDTNLKFGTHTDLI